MDWIEHDGTCCPVPVGTWVEARYRHGPVEQFSVLQDSTVPFPRDGAASCWFWWAVEAVGRPHHAIIAYRIPSSKHIEALRRIAENVRETENA